MAYNRKNLLNEIEEVQQIYSKHSVEGATATFIYNTYIKGIYHISERTFYTYLNTNVARERRLIAEGEEAKCQPSLFDFTTNADENPNNDK